MKAAMDMVGQHGGEVRLPLLPITEAERDELRAILTDMGLLD